VWIGEHFTATWEPCPAPDLLIAQALMQTERIRLGAGAHLLPYHHPAELAARVAYLDHLSGGRLMFGVGAGGVLTDFQLFGVDGIAGENRTMMWEALDMILPLWETFEPFEIKGEHWTVAQPAPAVHDLYQPHLRPLQQPHPPIAIAALSPNSGSLRMCGERGFSPMSLNQIDAEYGVQTNALVGSVDTVIAKLRKLQEEMGGFGTLLQLGYDYVEDPDPWYESMELLARDVMPALVEDGV
jgi:alkanesulfonate monooxygenase SsuD/methylene tetrahydromethanopterin reductase-like flavin-dependent oxidoreductase (luciferase family)